MSQEDAIRGGDDKKQPGSTMSDYGSPEYWEARYKAVDGTPPMTFEWYQSYQELKPYLKPYLKKTGDFTILIPGCGNSRLGADLYEDGYRDITNIDTSGLVIRQMNALFQHFEELEFREMDARDMKPLPDKSFDLVIDKGLFDSQLCSEGNVTNIGLLVREVHRVLKPGGIYLVISYGFPATRLGYLSSKRLDWTVEHEAIPKPIIPGISDAPSENNTHHLYICKKPN